MEKKMKPSEVAKSAERQMLALKNAEADKIKSVQGERDRVVELRDTLNALIYAAGDGFRKVYPQAEGFIEGRIKTPDSLEIKTRNEITEILSRMEEDPNINQEYILKKIEEIGFKDIFAFSIVTTKPPKHFQTGSDEKNKEFRKLSTELEASEKRMAEHKNFINTNKEDVIKLTEQIEELREKASLEEGENSDLQDRILEKTELLSKFKSNVDYGKRNLERTECVYNETSRDLEFGMSKYFVENLSKIPIFKYLGTVCIKSKKLEKPGFRAVNTADQVTFSGENGEKTTMVFEAQGKGWRDYQDAEFGEGAAYHEEQTTREGIISKNIDMPDFTIIGKDRTNKIEKEVRTKYNDITSVEDLEELGIADEIEEIQEYKNRISEEIQGKYKSRTLARKEIRKKVAEAFNKTKEFCIQREIDKKVNNCIDLMANNDSFDKVISQSEELKAIYEEEKNKIQEQNSNSSENEIDHLTKVRVLYRQKENEIKQYAQTSIPMFFRANLPEKEENEIQVYWLTTGESIYRYFINRLNGLKDKNGKYKYEPQEQQKKALFKLSGLFEEDLNNFYTYDKSNNSLGHPSGEER